MWWLHRASRPVVHSKKINFRSQWKGTITKKKQLELHIHIAVHIRLLVPLNIKTNKKKSKTASSFYCHSLPKSIFFFRGITAHIFRQHYLFTSINQSVAHYNKKIHFSRFQFILKKSVTCTTQRFCILHHRPRNIYTSTHNTQMYVNSNRINWKTSTSLANKYSMQNIIRSLNAIRRVYSKVYSKMLPDNLGECLTWQLHCITFE